MRFSKQKSGCAILGANRVVEASGLLVANTVVDSPCENTTTTTTCGLPDAPTGLEAADVTDTYILLGFDSVPGAILYEIWRSVDGGDSELYFITTTRNFADFNISDFEEYCYKVRVLTACGYSGFTEELCLNNGVTSTTSSTSTTSTSSTSTTSTTTAATTTTSTSTSTTSTSTTSTSTSTTTCGIPEIPDLPVVSEGPELGVDGFCSKTITWEIPPTADSVKLKIYKDGVPFALLTFSNGETSFDFGVECGYEWCFEFQACNDCGCSEFSGQACTDCVCTTTTTTTCALPETPDNPNLSGTGNCTGMISWTMVEGVTSTEIAISINGGEESVVVVPAPTGFYNFETEEGETWCFRIRFCNACGCSGWTAAEGEGVCGYFCETTTTTTTESGCDREILDWLDSQPTIGESTYWNQYLHYIACLGIDPEVTTTYTHTDGLCYEITPFPEDGPESYTIERVACP